MQLDQNTHAVDEVLESYAMGTLAEPSLGELEEHLLISDHCRERLADTDAYVTAMRSAAGGLDQRDESRKVFWARASGWLSFRRLGWAMAVVSLVLVGAALRLLLSPAQFQQPFAILLETSRGAELQRAPGGRPLEVSLDMRGLPAFPKYEMEMVDGGGRVVEASGVGMQGKVATRISKRLPPGTYFLRLYSPSRELLREYGLQIE
jgi:hypothetical protein